MLSGSELALGRGGGPPASYGAGGDPIFAHIQVMAAVELGKTANTVSRPRARTNKLVTNRAGGGRCADVAHKLKVSNFTDDFGRLLATVEARHTRQWQRDLERERKHRRDAPHSLGSGRIGPVALHQEKVMLHGIDAANSKRKTEEE